MTHSHMKTVAVANEMVFLGAIVVAEHLLVEVSEQVERLDVDVCSLESALEKAPEVFQPVGVNLSVNVAFGMVNRLVNKVLVVQSLIRQKRVSVDGAVC